MAVTSDSSSRTLPRAISRPRPVSLPAASSERASATSRSSAASSSRVVTAPPMKPVAPVTKMRPTSGGGGAGQLAAALRGGRLGAGLLEEDAHALHDLAGVLDALGWIGAPKRISMSVRRGSGFPGRRRIQWRPTGITSCEPDTWMGITRQVVLGGEDRGARAQAADPAVARARALGEHHEAPALAHDPVQVRGGGRAAATAVARDRDGVEEQRHRVCEPALGVEVVGRRRDRRAPAPGVREGAQDRRACPCGSSGWRRTPPEPRDPRSARGPARGGACRSPSPGRAGPSARPRAARVAGALRAHGTSSASRLRSPMPGNTPGRVCGHTIFPGLRFAPGSVPSNRALIIPTPGAEMSCSSHSACSVPTAW